MRQVKGGRQNGLHLRPTNCGTNCVTVRETVRNCVALLWKKRHVKAVIAEGPCLGCPPHHAYFQPNVKLQQLSGPRKLESSSERGAGGLWGGGRRENKGGKTERKARMSVEDKDDIGNDKSGCL